LCKKRAQFALAITDTQLDGEFRLVRSARAVMGNRMSAGVAQKADRCQIIITTRATVSRS